MKLSIAAFVIAVAALGLSFFGVKAPVGESPFGASAGPLFTERLEFLGGVLHGGVVATSSTASVTASRADLQAWMNSSLVSYTPNAAAITVTFPASSTISSIVPRAGDRQSFCMTNATSTAGTVITFAGGTGTALNVASSSATAIGSSVLVTGETGCFTLIRKVATASAFDIDILYSAFK